jgi:putative Mn2+ efflux pump MntP
MGQILLGSFLLSLLHALIPSHWLPILSIGKKENWSLKEITQVTLLSGLSHALSTIAIGVTLGYLGLNLSKHIKNFTHFIVPCVLIALGIYFIYQHHRHKHFHMNDMPKPNQKRLKIVMVLVIAMFFSPCLEIEAYFLLAGTVGWQMILAVALIYLWVSVSGMVIWVRLAYKGSLKFNWHGLEHNAGIITGWTLIITGIISFFIS